MAMDPIAIMSGGMVSGPVATATPHDVIIDTAVTKES